MNSNMNLSDSARCERPGNIVSRSISVIALLALSPLAAILFLLILADTRKWPIFSQQRIGLNERPFAIHKFRTMLDLRDATGKLLPDEARLTRLGKFLRSTSLDELPQLWNVATGKMAFVGPRPLLPEYLARYTAFQRRRHEAKPGITGWAQVNGRNNLTWQQKFEMDVWYVDHRSRSLDAKILWMTLLGVLRREGVQQEGHATMPEFLGTANSAATCESKS